MTKKKAKRRPRWIVVLEDDLTACGSAVRWARRKPSAVAAWKACRELEWLYFILDFLEWPTKDRDLRLLACDLLEPMLPPLEDEGLSEALLELARRQAFGDVAREEYRAACEARPERWVVSQLLRSSAGDALESAIEERIWWRANPNGLRLLVDRLSARRACDLIREVVPLAAVRQLARDGIEDHPF